MSRPARCAAILFLVIALGEGTATAFAADHVIAGTQLRLRRTPHGGTMTLLLRDVDVLPVPGSADDPSLAGMTITLFGRGSEQKAQLFALPGVGRAGWLVRTTPRLTYSYALPAALPGAPTPRTAVLRDGAGLRVRARATGLDLDAAEGAVAVRVEWGSERVCTIFDDAAVRRDAPGFFVGAKADVPQIADCDDATLGTAACGFDGGTCGGRCAGDGVCGGNVMTGCLCVSPSQPCGDSAPVCNGECPAGEECATTVGGPYPGCGCLPIGSMACGEVSGSCGGGDCPPGTGCYGFSLSVVDYCACATEPPPPPCGGECPDGWTCVGPVPGFPEMCVPPFCSGGSGAPACDGSCSGGNPYDTCTTIGSTCVCAEHCSGGDPFPTCGGTCSAPDTSCVAVDGKCLCG